jgi:hypothetical protein
MDALLDRSPRKSPSKLGAKTETLFGSKEEFVLETATTSPRRTKGKSRSQSGSRSRNASPTKSKKTGTPRNSSSYAPPEKYAHLKPLDDYLKPNLDGANLFLCPSSV